MRPGGKRRQPSPLLGSLAAEGFGTGQAGEERGPRTEVGAAQLALLWCKLVQVQPRYSGGPSSFRPFLILGWDGEQVVQPL